MKDVLLCVGKLVMAFDEDGTPQNYLIIGKRAYNPNSGKSWDYISVPFPDGFQMGNKRERPYENTNLYFFNHTDVCEVLV